MDCALKPNAIPISFFVAPPFVKNVNELGFRRKVDNIFGRTQSELYEICSCKISEKRKKKWAKYKCKPLPSRRKLKFLLREGIPNEFRARVWCHCLGSTELNQQFPYLYSNLSKVKLSNKISHQIGCDVERTFPSNLYFRSDSEIDKLRRVLHSVAVFFPNINYCQSMNFLAATFLLFMNEDLAFWSLVQVMSNHLMPNKGLNLGDNYDESMIGMKRCLYVMEQIMKKRTPSAVAALKKVAVELEWICNEWFLGLYIISLPIRTALRIWDTLFFEGPKILYRIALSIMMQFEMEINESETMDSVMHFFKKKIYSNTINHNKLLHFAFNKLTSFSRKEIDYFTTEFNNMFKVTPKSIYLYPNDFYEKPKSSFNPTATLHKIESKNVELVPL